jgi:hypothetical protein
MPTTTAFKKIKASLTSNYLNKPVPKEYQNRYGKRYDKKDIKSFAYAVAKSRGIKIDRRKNA